MLELLLWPCLHEMQNVVPLGDPKSSVVSNKGVLMHAENALLVRLLFGRGRLVIGDLCSGGTLYGMCGAVRFSLACASAKWEPHILCASQRRQRSSPQRLKWRRVGIHSGEAEGAACGR